MHDVSKRLVQQTLHHPCEDVGIWREIGKTVAMPALSFHGCQQVVAGLWAYIVLGSRAPAHCDTIHPVLYHAWVHHIWVPIQRVWFTLGERDGRGHIHHLAGSATGKATRIQLWTIARYRGFEIKET